MTPAAAVVAVETVIAATWVATPIAWPNVAFVPPVTGPWLRVDFLWGDGFIATKDGGSDVVGILQLGVFGPKDEGDGDLYALAETARAMFNRLRMGDVSFEAASGPSTISEESWRAVVVSLPFTVQEIVP